MEKGIIEVQLTGSKVNEITDLFILIHLVWTLPKKISLEFSRRFKKNSPTLVFTSNPCFKERRR